MIFSILPFFVPLVNFINSDFYIVFQIMTKYQIDEAESTAVDLSIYESLFHLCILIFGGFFFFVVVLMLGFLLGDFYIEQATFV